MECFIAVAEESSFTRAAERLHLVQSTVSATIVALERDVGAKLLERTSRTVRLTDAGQALLVPARRTLEMARTARDAVDSVAGMVTGTLWIGTMTSLAGLDLPRLLGEYHRRHPQVEIRMVSSAGGSPGLAQSLRARRLDLAFLSVDMPSVNGLRLLPVASTTLMLVVPTGHRLATRPSIRLGDVAGESFVDFPTGYGNRLIGDRAFAAAGVERQVVIEISDVEDGAAYVRNELGIALLPQSSQPTASGLSFIPVIDSDLTWQVYLAVPEQQVATNAARAFESLVREHVGSGQEG